jgi:hypothetical protein
MMYSTPIQPAAYRSALLPGCPAATAIVRFVSILVSRIVGAGQTGLVHMADIGPRLVSVAGNVGLEILEVR